MKRPLSIIAANAFDLLLAYRVKPTPGPTPGLGIELEKSSQESARNGAQVYRVLHAIHPDWLALREEEFDRVALKGLAAELAKLIPPGATILPMSGELFGLPSAIHHGPNWGLRLFCGAVRDSWHIDVPWRETGETYDIQIDENVVAPLIYCLGLQVFCGHPAQTQRQAVDYRGWGLQRAIARSFPIQRDIPRSFPK